MIKLVHEGHYILVETKAQIKILTLGDAKTYAWVYAKDIGELLVSSHLQHIVDHVLCVGRYRLYEVKDEPALTDLTHLELFVGGGKWQGYLLPTGLPKAGKVRSRIIPTQETISKSML